MSNHTFCEESQDLIEIDFVLCGSYIQLFFLFKSRRFRVVMRLESRSPLWQFDAFVKKYILWKDEIYKNCEM